MSMTATVARRGKARARMNREDLAKVFQALADPTRIQMMEILTRGPVESAREIAGALDRQLAQPTISHHVGILCDAGMVRSEKRGVFVSYEIVSERLSQLARWMEGV